MRTEISKRKYDNKFVVWGWLVDPTIDDISEKNIPYISMRWIAMGIYDTFHTALHQSEKLRNAKKQ
jgi:hypothetical protein